MGEQRNYAALDWVVGEIGETLKEARQALEAFVEDPRDVSRLRFCLTHIHQVLGSLQMIEFHGAALIAEEVELLAQSLIQNTVTHVHEAQEVLMRALLQLPIYLEHVQRFKDDHPGVLLPLLNDIRAVRKQPFLSESGLFAPDLSRVNHIIDDRHPVLQDRAKLIQALKKLREMYQYAAASLLKDIKISENLEYIDKVCTRVELMSRGTHAFVLWQAACGVVENLRSDEIELSAAVRSLLRRLARELKVLAENAPAAFDAPVDENLLRNLLYYTARAERMGPHGQALRQKYHLDKALKDGAETGRHFHKTMISAPDPEAIRSVVAALQEELNTVKHILGMTLAGQAGVSDMEEILPIMKRLADTLAVLAIPELRKFAQDQYDQLAHSCRVGSIDPEQLVNLAGRIVEIEHKLDAVSKSAGKRDLANLDGRQIEVDSAKETVIRESRLGLEQCKEAIVEFYASKWDRNYLTAAPDLLANIRGGLSMIGEGRAAAALEACSRFIQQQFLSADYIPDAASLTALANAVEGVDYYLERMLEQTVVSDVTRFLLLAEENLRQLNYPAKGRERAEAPAVAEPIKAAGPSPYKHLTAQAANAPTIEATASSPVLANERVDVGQAQALASASSTVPFVQPTAEPAPQPKTPSAPVITAPEASIHSDDSSAELSAEEESEENNLIDDEIIEVFIEEAGEVLATLDEYYPQWTQALDNSELLTVIRRAFHTLKGSGRMVGAQDVGEVAWSVENMLNRVLDRSISVQDVHLIFINRVMGFMPALVDAFAGRKRNPDPALTQQLIGLGQALARGEVPELASAEVEQELEGDDEQTILFDLFASEAITHLVVVDAFIAHMRDLAPLFTPPSDSLQRALHTLKGSAHMANVVPVASITTPLESFSKELRAYQVNLNADILQLLQDASSYVHGVVADIKARRAPSIPAAEQFIARVHELKELYLDHLIRMKEQVSPDGHKQVDPRLLTIFMAEDMRLLLDADQILNRWQHDASEDQTVRNLVEELGRLQAGAAQANLPEMAQFSGHLALLHELALVALPQANEAYLEHLVPAHEFLLDMVDAVAAGQNLPEIPHVMQQALTDLYRELSDSLAAQHMGTDEQLVLTSVEALEANLDESAHADTYEEAVDAEEAEFLEVSQSEALVEETESSEHAFEAEHYYINEDEFELPGVDELEAAVEAQTMEFEGQDLADAESEYAELKASEEAVAEKTFVEETLAEEVDDADLFGTLTTEEILELQSENVEPQEESLDLGAYASAAEDPLLGDMDLDLVTSIDSHLSADDTHSLLETAGDDLLLPSAAETFAADVEEDEVIVPLLDELVEVGADDEPVISAVDDFDPIPVVTEALDLDAIEQSDTELSQAPDEVFDTSYTLDLDEGYSGDDSLTADDDQIALGNFDLGDEDLADLLIRADEPVIRAGEPTEEPVPADAHKAAVSTSFIPQSTTAQSTSDASAAQRVEDDFDPEILEIFLEEADELMEELDESIHTWESDWDSVDAPDVMKRALHTLKGGARLASQIQLGELTHNYESYLISVGGPRGDVNFFATILAYQDQLLKSIRKSRLLMDGAPAEALEESAPTVAAPTLTTKVSEPHTSTSPVPFLSSKNVVSVAPVDTKEVVEAFASSVVTNLPDFVARSKGGSQEVIKVSSDLLEELVNLAGETSISRGRIEQQIKGFGTAINEIDGTLRRLQEQLRRLDIETEAQILFRQEQLAENEAFDPLEMDRYSQLQQLSRSLTESASDLVDLKRTLSEKVKDTEAILLQQSRINSSLQEGLMRSRMVPFSRLVPRLRRIVRQVAGELGKHVSFELDNVEGEMDRSVLERMVAPLEHMLRNAVDHGIEPPAERLSKGKPEFGRILLSLAREGSDILLRLADDGRGISLDKVRKKAVERGLMAENSQLSDHEVMQFILQAGFSTAESVTQISGRGVGMDVVAAEIKQLGGSMTIESRSGVGSQFTVRLPFTVSVNRALMVTLGKDTYAIPLNAIEGIVRVSPFELEHYYQQPDARFEYADENYQVRYLGGMLYEGTSPKLEGQLLPLPVILVRSAQHTMALQVDGLQGSREIVVKSLGKQFAAVQGLSGATVMGDGSVVVILDVHALVRKAVAFVDALPLTHERTKALNAPRVQKTVMVVDDSVTVRKVTTRFLEREGYLVITAKDGVDALKILQDHTPDLMLLDIEMPRMDGFEVAKNIRTTARWKHIPIVMITSRTGDKHREHALSIGVNEYLGKPYQEDVLAGIVGRILGDKGA
ncbi:MAG TPA: Hpt domain-containing protein [Cellvibrionaceae bacterium]